MIDVEAMDRWLNSPSNKVPVQEMLKHMSEAEKVDLLQRTYDKYGVRSNAFFKLIEQLITWTMKRYLRGMNQSYVEDLVNNAYEELIIAFEGGYTTHYNKPVYKAPLYGTQKYYNKYKNIGAFIMYVIGSSVSKYRSKNFRKQVVHEDIEQDISDRLNYLNFEMDNALDYSMQEPNIEPIFHKFKFNENLEKHLAMLKETHPRNNVLYNFMLWKEKI